MSQIVGHPSQPDQENNCILKKDELIAARSSKAKGKTIGFISSKTYGKNTPLLAKHGRRAFCNVSNVASSAKKSSGKKKKLSARFNSEAIKKVSTKLDFKTDQKAKPSQEKPKSIIEMHLKALQEELPDLFNEEIESMIIAQQEDFEDDELTLGGHPELDEVIHKIGMDEDLSIIWKNEPVCLTVDDF